MIVVLATVAKILLTGLAGVPEPASVVVVLVVVILVVLLVLVLVRLLVL